MEKSERGEHSFMHFIRRQNSLGHAVPVVCKLDNAHSVGKTETKEHLLDRTVIVKFPVQVPILSILIFLFNFNMAVQCCVQGEKCALKSKIDHTIQKHKFSPIECYRGSMCRPSYDKKYLKISLKLVIALTEMQNEADSN